MNKALLIGLNKYLKQPALQGCINDVADVKQALLDHGTVAAGDVLELVDDNATKKAILAALIDMVNALGAGDCGYVHFSGHGTRMTTTDPNEPDGMDEVLCPFEFDWTDETAIRDNELLDVLAGLTLDARMILTIDSCHSGDMSRLVVPPNSRARTIPAPLSVAMRRGPVRNGFRAAGRAPNVAFASACSPWQVASDTAFDGRPNGAFTYYFVKQANATAAGTSLTDLIAAIEPPLQPYDMTPVAENGAMPYFATAAREARRARSFTRAVSSARAASIVFEQAFHASLLGQDLAVAVRIIASNGELTSYVTASVLGETLASPPIRTMGEMTFPIALGIFGMRLVFTVSDWQMSARSVRFLLELDVTSDLPFVGRTQVARVPVSITLAGIDRGLTTPDMSPADLLAVLTLKQMGRDAAGPQGSRDPGPSMRGFRDPLIEVVDSGVAKWGPNWREDRVIRPFENRPRPDGVRRHSVEIGPQRGSGNVYVVGWLSDQETDFDFILHMGNNFFGGWGEIDWRVQGYYADIQPFPRDLARVGPPATSSERSKPRGVARPTNGRADEPDRVSDGD